MAKPDDHARMIAAHMRPGAVFGSLSDKATEAAPIEPPDIGALRHSMTIEATDGRGGRYVRESSASRAFAPEGVPSPLETTGSRGGADANLRDLNYVVWHLARRMTTVEQRRDWPQIPWHLIGPVVVASLLSVTFGAGAGAGVMGWLAWVWVHTLYP